MKLQRYTLKTLSTGKVAVYRSTGTMVSKFSSEASAKHHVARQEAEDREFRTARIADYLAERAARPVIVASRSDQLNLF